MTVMPRAVLAAMTAMMAMNSLADAQTIYKCTDANGVTSYTQVACSTDPDGVKTVTVRVSKPPTAAPDAASATPVATSPDVTPGTMPGPTPVLSVDRAGCVAAAQARAFEPLGQTEAETYAKIEAINLALAEGQSSIDRYGRKLGDHYYALLEQMEIDKRKLPRLQADLAIARRVAEAEFARLQRACPGA